jgi:hypothetical protein
VLRGSILSVAAALALSATATAATPAQSLAARLKTSLQNYYVQANPAFEMGVVTCKIAAGGKTARCNAHFTVTGAHAGGDFVLSVTINRTSGEIHTKTLSAVCKDTKTGKTLHC